MMVLFLVLLHIIHARASSDGKRLLQLADEYHSTAISYIEQGDYDHGLAYFRAACRLNNQSSLYWNDLGVTEMRLNMWHKAHQRFVAALTVDPGFDVAKANIEELVSYIQSGDAYVPPHALAQKHAILCPIELSHNDFAILAAHQAVPKRNCVDVDVDTCAGTADSAASSCRCRKTSAHFQSPFVVRAVFPLLGIDPDRANTLLDPAAAGTGDEELNISNGAKAGNLLMTKYGRYRADYYPQNMFEEQSRPFFSSLEEALYQLLTVPRGTYPGVDASQPGTYVQWNLDRAVLQELWRDLSYNGTNNGTSTSTNCTEVKSESNTEDGTESISQSMWSTGRIPAFMDDAFWTFRCFNQSIKEQAATQQGDQSQNQHQQQDYPDKVHEHHHSEDSVMITLLSHISQFYLSTHWHMLLIGEKGAGMFSHQDTLRTASWQLQLVGRKRWHLCGPGESGHLYDAAGEVDLFHPNYDTHPRALNATCIEVVLSPGDLLYYPADYWHQTLNLDTPSISLSGTLINALNHQLVREELRNECAGANRIFAPHAEMCADLEACFALWDELYMDQ
mmetsp:Transcript_10296/g.17234  ORF Transcript_10296/g.17234 Transcript_10296/m.17234 type:complete len:563 (+) Transcript_10296:42-1730(+)